MSRQRPAVELVEGGADARVELLRGLDGRGLAANQRFERSSAKRPRHAAHPSSAPLPRCSATACSSSGVSSPSACTERCLVMYSSQFTAHLAYRRRRGSSESTYRTSPRRRANASSAVRIICRPREARDLTVLKEVKRGIGFTCRCGKSARITVRGQTLCYECFCASGKRLRGS
jgi:hypothetical protein